MCRTYIILGLITATSWITAFIPMLQTASQHKEAYNSSKPTIIMYSGSHCGPCKATKPHFHTLASQNSDFQYYIVETNNSAFDSIMSSFNITSIPTFIFSHAGKVVHRATGGLTRSQLNNHMQTFRSKLPKPQAAVQTPKKVTPAPQKKSLPTKQRPAPTSASRR